MQCPCFKDEDSASNTTVPPQAQWPQAQDNSVTLLELAQCPEVHIYPALAEITRFQLNYL
jgi:hypothetical protein